MTQSEVILIQNLCFRWHKNEPFVLDLPQLSVQRGEKLFIKGASGSGKTTLLSLISGVLLPEKGSVCVLGQSMEKLGSAERDAFRAEHIGFIFQMFNLIPYLPVIDNVLLPCRFSRKRRQNVERRNTTLKEEAARLLDHLDIKGDLLQRRVTALSVGQQQRVAAARALIGGPELIIADEPTSALDADRRRGFLQLLLKECAEQNTTLIFVSHDSSLETNFERGIHLDEVNRVGMTEQ